MRGASLTAVGTTFVRATFQSGICKDDIAPSLLNYPLAMVSALLRRFFWLRRFFVRLVAFMDPGILEYLHCRNSCIEELTLKSLNKGIKQVLVLGAGYDSRAYRLQRKGVRFFEVDHPDTQRKKRKRFENLAERAKLKFVEADLSQDQLNSILANSGFDQSAPTLVIWEGVSMFLKSRDVSKTLFDLRRLCPKGSEIVVDFLYPDKERQQTQCVAAKSVGEPCTFSISPNQLDQFVRRSGWGIEQCIETQELRERFGNPVDVSRGPLTPMSYVARLV